MKEQIELLVKLQEKDEVLGKLRKQVFEGPERIKELDKKLAAEEEKLKADTGLIEAMKKEERGYESEVEDSREQMQKSKTRLMSIKSNKEYQAVLTEIDTTERAIAEKEDKILAVMEQTEKLKQTVQNREKDLSAMRYQCRRERKEIEAEVQEANSQLNEAERHRTDITKNMEPQLISRYEQIKARMGTVAVAGVENATCGGCHMNIPPQMYNELQRGNSLKHCPHCDRIIYWKVGAAAA